MSHHDKRPAFPSHFNNFSDHNELAPDGQLVPPRTSVFMPGMTLRQYFAANAPEVPDDFAWKNGETDLVQRIARWRWQYADLMLATENGAQQ